MSDQHDTQPEPDDVALLLPWFATGQLTQAETARLEAVLAADPERQRHLGLAREERDATVAINEALGAPSRGAAARVFARIDAEAAPLRGGALRLRLRRQAEAFLAPARPWLAAAAAIVILAQAGGLAYLAATHQAPGSTYATASGPEKAASPGRLALAGFVPGASFDAVAHLLETNHVTIVDGPQGGLVTLRLGDAAMPQEQADGILAKLRDDSSIVFFAAPKQ